MKPIYVESKVTVVILLEDDEPPEHAQRILSSLVAEAFEGSFEDYRALRVEATRTQELGSDQPSV